VNRHETLGFRDAVTSNCLADADECILILMHDPVFAKVLVPLAIARRLTFLGLWRGYFFNWKVIIAKYGRSSQRFSSLLVIVFDTINLKHVPEHYCRVVTNQRIWLWLVHDVR